MQRLDLIVTSLALLLGFSYGLAAAEPTVLLQSKVATDGDFLVLPVQIAGKQYSFMVDTGALVSILDQSFQDKLTVFDESIAETDVLPGVKSKLYNSPPLTIQGNEAGTLLFKENSPVYCIDLSKARQASDQQIDGVLGMDFLGRYALRLDLAAGELKLLDSGTVTEMPQEASLSIDMVEGKLPNSDIVGYQPCVQINSGNISYWALIDTGAMWASLFVDRQTHKVLIQHQRLSPWPLMRKEDGVTKIGTSDPATLRDLTLGPFTHYLLDVKGAERCCKLGIPYWQRYHATFDFPAGRLLLDKGPLFEMTDEAGHSGIFVEEANDGKSKVVSLLMFGCSAQQNGVQVGDQILSINGESTEEMSRYHLLRRLSERREQVCELSLKRDDKEFTVTLPMLDKMPDLSKTR